MANGVFLHRADSRYDDRPEQHYQFPKQYLSRAEQFVGEWIIYYEPVKGGGRGYFAVAKVDRIVPDPTTGGMYLALIEDGTYLPFETTVPFNGQYGIVETGLLNDAGAISGRAQSAVRAISDDDFVRIVDLGIPERTDVLPREDRIDHADLTQSVRTDRLPFEFEIDRPRIERLVSRPLRDRVFRHLVLEAYGQRCAVSGLKFINGGGRAEVQAAHIRPVGLGGPDIVSNGVALSGTAHWMFDRGLIGFTDDFEIVVSRQVNDIDSVWQLANSSRRLLVPHVPALRPHPRFLAWHRENCFKC